MFIFGILGESDFGGASAILGVIILFILASVIDSAALQLLNAVVGKEIIFLSICLIMCLLIPLSGINNKEGLTPGNLTGILNLINLFAALCVMLSLYSKYGNPWIVYVQEPLHAWYKASSNLASGLIYFPIAFAGIAVEWGLILFPIPLLQMFAYEMWSESFEKYIGFTNFGRKVNMILCPDTKTKEYYTDLTEYESCEIEFKRIKREFVKKQRTNNRIEKYAKKDKYRN